MSPSLEPGIEASNEFEVEGRLLTDVGGTIGFSVLSTPAMIAMMERTAAMLVYPRLDDGKATVGFEVCVRHVASAPAGSRCTARARLDEIVDGSQAALRRGGCGRGRAYDRRRHTRTPDHRRRRGVAVMSRFAKGLSALSLAFALVAGAAHAAGRARALPRAPRVADARTGRTLVWQVKLGHPFSPADLKPRGRALCLEIERVRRRTAYACCVVGRSHNGKHDRLFQAEGHRLGGGPGARDHRSRCRGGARAH